MKNYSIIHLHKVDIVTMSPVKQNIDDNNFYVKIN